MNVTQSIATHFGSKRGFVHYLIGQAGLALGLYRPLQSPDFSRVRRLVFVCHGNICRSAMGDAVARHLNMVTSSCGLHASPGKPADPRAICFATHAGIDLGYHRSVRADQMKFSESDLVIAMEPAHIRGLVGLVGNAQLTLLGLWLPRPIVYLHDPYNTVESYFETCMEKIVVAVNQLQHNLMLFSNL